MRADSGSFCARGPGIRPRRPTQRLKSLNVYGRRYLLRLSAVGRLNTAPTDRVVHRAGPRCRAGRPASHILFAVVECRSTPRFRTDRWTIYSWGIYPKTRLGDGRILMLFYSSMQYHGQFELLEPIFGGLRKHRRRIPRQRVARE